MLIAKPGGRYLPGFVFVWLLFLPAVSMAAPVTADQLARQADSLKLSEKRYWHTLLHYRPSWRGLRSLIDDPEFFLAENGKRRPDEELAATLDGFLQPVGADPDSHPRCRFPARYHWLDQHLDLDDRLPAMACPKFAKIKGEIKPRSAELIFPGSNFNNPASMFGHTLVNINGPYKSKLLSHALNYSAFTEEKNGFAYAVKGILGFYRGFYSVLPYYAKLKQYNDLERRDIWEYELNLDRQEMERMFRHIWELEEIYSDYFFFDENCAYQLLFLFDAARPSLRLVEQARPWVIPVDTVRLLEQNGLITATAYRPSKATRIAWIVVQMSQDEKRLAAQLLDQEELPEAVNQAGFTGPEKVRVLDLAIETLEFQYLKRDVERPEYRQRYLSLLKQRSYLDLEEPAVPPVPVPTRPDRGHGSNRVALLGGETDDEPFAEVRLRPAYHNLLDADAGYLAGSQIEFASLVVRHYPGLAETRLQQLDLVSIVSLSPRHDFYKPISWKLDAGFTRRLFRDGKERMLFRVNPGGGFTFGNDRQMAFLLMETELQFADGLRDNYLLGFGGSGGVLAGLGDRLKLKLELRHSEYLFGDQASSLSGGEVGLNWKLSTNSSLVVEAARTAIHDEYRSEVMAGFNYYW